MLYSAYTRRGSDECQFITVNIPAMNKIIAAFDGLRFSESTMQYAIYLAQRHHAHITGVFLKESTSLGFAVYETIVTQSTSGRNLFDEIDKTDAAETNKAVETFSAACSAAGINYNIHRDRKDAVKELIHETVFADLLVVDAWETFSYISSGMPGWFIKNVLHEAHCPIILPPKNFKPLTKIILLYDGTPSSVHAIKMCNYILPELKRLPAELLSATNDPSSSHLPDNKLLREWVKRHYPDISYKVLKGNRTEIITALKSEEPGALVVAGAYHRSTLSMWFHESLADLLVRETRMPVFIAHA